MSVSIGPVLDLSPPFEHLYVATVFTRPPLGLYWIFYWTLVAVRYERSSILLGCRYHYLSRATQPPLFQSLARSLYDRGHLSIVLGLLLPPRARWRGQENTEMTDPLKRSSAHPYHPNPSIHEARKIGRNTDHRNRVCFNRPRSAEPWSLYLLYASPLHSNTLVLPLCHHRLYTTTSSIILELLFDFSGRHATLQHSARLLLPLPLHSHPAAFVS